MGQATNQYYMYVLACSDGTLYTGYTTSLARRELAHQTGRGAKYTKPSYRRPVKMIFSVVFPTKSQAMSAEYHFKQYSRPHKEALLGRCGVRTFTIQAQERVDVDADTWERQQEEGN